MNVNNNSTVSNQRIYIHRTIIKKYENSVLFLINNETHKCKYTALVQNYNMFKRCEFTSLIDDVLR